MKTHLQNSAYDMLSITKCVSYIGRVHELNHPVFKPTIFLRDQIAFVVYGIGHIKDNTLMTILQERRYTIEPVPVEVVKSINEMVIESLEVHVEIAKLAESH